MPGLESHPIFGDSSQITANATLMMKDGWKSVGRVFILALALDAVYQIIVLHFVYAGEMVIVAFVLAIVPYLIVRGLATRLAHINQARHHAGAPVLKH